MKSRKGFGLPLEIIIVLAVAGIVYGLAVMAYRLAVDNAGGIKELPLYIKMEDQK